MMYKIEDVLMYNTGNRYCMLLLRKSKMIVDQEVREGKEGREFILQIWSCEGKNVFEIECNRKPYRWNEQFSKVAKDEFQYNFII